MPAAELFARVRLAASAGPTPRWVTSSTGALLVIVLMLKSPARPVPALVPETAAPVPVEEPTIE
jgi:hypothetical protein